MEKHYSAWNESEHLQTFSDYALDLPIYTRYRNQARFHNLGRCLKKVLPFSESVVEVGVGGGRSYTFFDALRREMGYKSQYRGYDISPQCVEYCQKRFGDFFDISTTTSPKYQNADLLFFFDVLVHSAHPRDFLDSVCESTKKFLCFQTPTRDNGSTVYNPDQSCRLENGKWVPWIVFNINELIEELQKRGFDKFLVIKKYKKFAGNAPRFLPREFFEPNTGSSRTSVLAIRENSLVDEITSDQEMANDVNVIVSTPGPSVPYGVALLNSVYRRVIASKKRYTTV